MKKTFIILLTFVYLVTGIGFGSKQRLCQDMSQMESHNERRCCGEEAWNAGVQFSQDFIIISADRPATLVLDFYRTEFQNQVVVDMEQSGLTS
jgi:hypothetical protein